VNHIASALSRISSSLRITGTPVTLVYILNLSVVLSVLSVADVTVLTESSMFFI